MRGFIDLCCLPNDGSEGGALRRARPVALDGCDVNRVRNSLSKGRPPQPHRANSTLIQLRPGRPEDARTPCPLILFAAARFIA